MFGENGAVSSGFYRTTKMAAEYTFMTTLLEKQVPALLAKVVQIHLLDMFN